MAIKLWSVDATFIDFSEVVTEHDERVTQILKMHPLNTVKQQITFYSVICRDRLGDLLASLNVHLPYLFRDRPFVVHCGIAPFVADSLHCASIAQFCMNAAQTQTLRHTNPDYVALLMKADEEITKFVETYDYDDMSLDVTLIRELYDSFRDPTTTCSFADFRAEISDNLLEALMGIIGSEMKMCGKETQLS